LPGDRGAWAPLVYASAPKFHLHVQLGLHLHSVLLHFLISTRHSSFPTVPDRVTPIPIQFPSMPTPTRPLACAGLYPSPNALDSGPPKCLCQVYAYGRLYLPAARISQPATGRSALIRQPTDRGHSLRVRGSRDSTGVTHSAVNTQEHPC